MIYFPHVERALIFCVIFYVCGTRYGVIVLYFCMWNALWRYFAIFSVCGTRSSVIVLYFPRVERALKLLCYIFTCVEHALAVLCYIFRMWNALLSYCDTA